MRQAHTELNCMVHEEGKRGMSTERGDVSPASLQKYLGGIDYPADKQKLMSTARDNNAPDTVMDVIQRLPDRQYNGPTEVSRAFGEMK